MEKNDGIWGRSSLIGGNKYIVFSSQYSPKDTLIGLGLKDIGCKHLRRGCGSEELQDAYIINASNFNDSFVIECLQTPEDFIILDKCDWKDRRKAIAVAMQKTNTNQYIPMYIGSQYIGKMQSIYKEEAMDSDDWFYDKERNQYFTIK